MTQTVAVTLGSIRKTLLDASAVTWTDPELVQYLNEAIEQTCLVKPDSYVIEQALVLVPGVVQELPDDAVSLLDVPFNADGEAVTQVDKALLEAADPRWAAQTPTTAIQHYTADPRNPRRFLVYPPAAVNTQVTAVWCSTPPAVTGASTVPLPAAFIPALIDYTLYRAYGKNSKRQDITKAGFHKQQWAAALGLKTPAQYANAPRITQGTPT